MKLIIGLGNPDIKYQSTRHNLGRRIIEEFASQKNLNLNNSSKLSAHLAEIKGTVSGDKIIIGFPNEYMNNSGIAVGKIAQFYKIEPKDIYIVHDELDLPAGEYRIQFDRGPAGHNGIKSVIEHLSTQAFNRIRVGIGKPLTSIPIEDYVLTSFASAERDIIDKTIPKVLEELQKIIEV